jgi:hypothetical protein
MVPCVNDGAEFEAHIVEVIKLARELVVTTIEKAAKGNRDHALFYPALDHMCIHTGGIILVFAGLEMFQHLNPTARIDTASELMIDLAHYGVFDQ